MSKSGHMLKLGFLDAFLIGEIRIIFQRFLPQNLLLVLSSRRFQNQNLLALSSQQSSCKQPHRHVELYTHTHTHTHTILETIHIFYMCRITKQHGGRLRKQAAQKEVEFVVKKDIMAEEWQDMSHHLTKFLRLFWVLAHKESHRGEPAI